MPYPLSFRCLLATATALLVVLGTGSAHAQIETYTVNVSRAQYNMGGTGLVIDDTFDSDTDFGPLIQIGDPAVTDPLAVDGSLDWWVFSGSDATPLGGLTGGLDSKLAIGVTADRFDQETGVIRRLVADTDYSVYQSNESHFSAAFEDFNLGVDTPNVAYSFGLEIEDTSNNEAVWISGTWFSGIFAGQTFDHALALEMGAENFNTGDVRYSSGLTFLTGPFDPLNTQVELGIDLLTVSGDTQFTGWFSIDGSLPQAIDSTTITGVDLTSYPSTEPAMVIDYQYVPIPGDFDDSGAIDPGDVDALFAMDGAIITEPGNPYDLISDNIIITSPNTIGSDMDILIRHLAGTEYGDTNLDKVVGPADLTNLKLFWLGIDAGWAGGDFNGDGVTGPADLTTMKLFWLFNNASSPEQSIPEPMSAVLLGLAGLGVIRRRRG